MKTISGKLVWSRPISLSKAAKLLSRFTASDNEASPAFGAYLRRTSAAFNELVQLHRECKHQMIELRDKKDPSIIIVTEGTSNSGKIAVKDGVPAMEMNNTGEGIKTGIDHEASNVGEFKKKHKKQQSRPGAEESENGRNIETEAANKKSNRKRKHESVTDGELDGSREAVKSKKKKM